MSTEMCGCCEPLVPATPVSVANRPGLSAIAYRVGTFASFRRAMLEAISEQPELASLRTRLSDDYAITLLELWAIVADVLTFYQERMANEAFLRTATQRDSVLRMARMIDYHLRPGMAATAYLAFTVEKEKEVEIPVGLKVQSVPGQDELPQKFETLEAMKAQAKWNRLRVVAQPQSDNPLAKGRTKAFFPPTSAGLLAASNLKPDDRVLIFEGGEFEEMTVKEVRQQEGWMVVEWTGPISQGWGKTARIYKRGKAIQLFGYNATKYYVLNNENSQLEAKDPVLDINPSEPFYLDGHYEDVKPGQKILQTVDGKQASLRKISKVGLESKTVGNLTDTISALTLGGSTPKNIKLNQVVLYELLGNPVQLWFYDNGTNSLITKPTVYLFGALIDSDTIDVAREITGQAYGPGLLFNLKEIELGRRVMLADDSHAPVTATITGVSTWFPFPSLTIRLGLRDWLKIVSIQGVELNQNNSTREDLLKLTKYFGTFIDPPALLPSMPPEIVTSLTNIRKRLSEENSPTNKCKPTSDVLSWILETPAYLQLDLNSESADIFSLDSESSLLLGNVAFASHGETVENEILGDGDASSKFQEFSLKKLPVTHARAPGINGMSSSLQVVVDGMRWKQAPSLYGRKSTEQIYTARIEDDETLRVKFGDGKTGTRLPSGRGNIVATYRQGAGLDGRVQSNSISTLLDRPVGLKSVINPLASEGGADPETLDRARENAPNKVKIFGRAISLSDYEDLIRASGEVAKAHATWVWNGEQRAVYLTIAGQEGSEFSDDTLVQLHKGLMSGSDPNHQVMLANYEQVPIVVSASISVDPDLDITSEEMEENASSALLEALSFKSLAFGEPIHLSDIYAVLQNVPGVISVDIDQLHFKQRDKDYLEQRGATYQSPQGHLRIYPARWSPQSEVIIPAEQAWVESPTQDIVITTIPQPAWSKSPGGIGAFLEEQEMGKGKRTQGIQS